jgi:hypothetical protein
MTMPYRIYNTWMGDPAKLILLDVINKTIVADGLQAGTNAAGVVLKVSGPCVCVCACARVCVCACA